MIRKRTVSSGSALRVLYCADVAGTGGGRRHRDALVAGLRTTGLDVTEFAGVVDALRNRAPNRARLTGWRRLAGTLALVANTTATTVRLTRELRRGGYDVLLWRPGLFQIHGAVAARLAGIPFVAEVNAPVAREARAFRGYAMLGLASLVERWTLRHAVHAISVSREAAASTTGPTTVVPNGGGYIDAEEHDGSRRWAETSCPLCSDGSVNPASGPDEARYAVLLETFRSWHGDEERKVAVSALPDGWTALVLGTGPGRPAFMNWVRDSGMADRVYAPGWVEPAGVQHLLSEHASLGLVLYAQMDEFWFSPLKLYDFLAHGVPVVVTDLGQAGEVGRRTGAVLAPPGDLARLVHAVRTACTTSGGRADRTDPHTSPFGWTTTIRRYAEILTASVTDDRLDPARYAAGRETRRLVALGSPKLGP